MQIKSSLRLKQQLGLTPQLQEAIRLMQFSAMELCAKIDTLAESNPLLEVEYLDHQNIDSTWSKAQYRYDSKNFQRITHHVNDDDDEFLTDNNQPEDISQSLHSLLLSQLNQIPLSTKEEIIGLVLIDAINSDGYLNLSFSEIITILEHQGLSVNNQEISSVLSLIQSFDPAGVGARDLNECLSLQLNRQYNIDAAFFYAQKILREDLKLFMQKSNHKLIKLTGLTEEEFTQGWALIKGCNPRPGNDYVSVEHANVKPDVTVQKINNRWKIELNEEMLPRVSINQTTLSLLHHAKDEKDRRYLREQLREAQWLIHSIQTRQQTLMSVVQAILSHQQPFLEQGPIALRPLTLKTIALALDKHESTVSRIIAHKTLLTPQGLYELKYFFSSHIKSKSGTDLSSKAIRVLLHRLIAEENPRKPYSDNALSQIMKEQGILLARRTVRKYRESLGLLSSAERRLP